MARKLVRKPITVGFQDDGALRTGDMSSLDRGKDMNAKALRVIMPMSKTARGGGKFDFSVYDRIVDEAARRGIRTQMVLDTTGGHDHDANGRDFAVFARAAGRHFKGRVQRYSLVNEPDMRFKPEKYRELYVRGRAGLKAADPKSHILFGELSPRDPVGYTKRVLKDGNIRAEGFALHPYQFNSDPLAPATPNGHDAWAGSIGRLGQVGQQLGLLKGLRTPMGNRPGMFLTEFGYATKGANTVSPEQAAAWWPRAIKKAQGAGARQIIAYHMSPERNLSSPWDTGLIDHGGNPRPAYEALRALLLGRQ